MGTLIHLPERPPRRKPVATDAAIAGVAGLVPAQILFFTGVRYERQDASAFSESVLSETSCKTMANAAGETPRPRSRRG